MGNQGFAGLRVPRVLCLLMSLLIVIPSGEIRGQNSPPPLPEGSVPPTASPPSVGESGSPSPPGDRTEIQALEARVRELEQMVRASVTRQFELEERLRQASTPGIPSTTSPGNVAGSVTVPYPALSTPTSERASPSSSPSSESPNMPGSFNELLRGAPAGLSATAPPGSSADMPPTPLRLPLGGTFGNGFEFKTADDEYVIQFHNLTQFDGRFYLEGTQQFVRDTFLIPRQWFFFNGRLTKPFEYYVAFAEAFDQTNLLDAYLNIHYDDRLQLRLGRYKTPFTYEFYSEPIQGLVNPERSLFFNNFAVNRDLGIMAWGQILDKEVDYAVGIFNGLRNGFIDSNDEKDVMAFLNYKPFLNGKDDRFKNLQFGGSVDAGQENSPALPRTLRTITPTAGSSAIGTAFLEFSPDVREVGFRNFWTGHIAWYSGSLSLISEYQGGYQRYALADQQQTRLKVPVQSFYVQMGYFLTGEEVVARGTVNPIRPFDIRKGKVGPGAIEPVARFNYLNVGRDVFTAGLSNPNDWTNQLYLVDLGVNWYLNRFIKFYFGWEHAEFGDPVLFGPDRRQLTSDLFWFRTQIYF